MRTSYATKAVLASPPGQRPAKGVRGCADPDFATAPQSLRGAVVKRETERGQNRVSLDAVRAEVGITPLEPTPPRPWSRRRAVCVPVKSAASKLSSNAFRAHLAEFGIVVVQGIRHVRELIARVFAEDILIFPPRCVRALRPLVAQPMELRLQIKSIEKELLAWHRTSHGVGFITATMEPLKLCAH
jgi:hypothetical protein